MGWMLVADIFTPNFVELTSDDIPTNSRKLLDAGVRYPFGELDK